MKGSSIDVILSVGSAATLLLWSYRKGKERSEEGLAVAEEIKWSYLFVQLALSIIASVWTIEAFLGRISNRDGIR